MKAFCILSLLVVAPIGCQKRIERPDYILKPDDGEYVLTILLDMSGSFSSMMADDGKAYAFVCQVLDKYFRDRLGTQDRLILAQLSGNERALLWQGTPAELRQEFASASEFRDFLMAKADPNSSLIHAGLAQAVEYSLEDPVVVSGKGKPAVFVLSDMLDTSVESEQSKKRAVAALADFGKKGGVVGIYYVDTLLCSQWRQIVRDAGFSPAHYRVEADIVGRPALPNFD